MRSLLLSLALLSSSCAPADPDPPRIKISDAWARATAPGQAAAVYLTLANHGGGDKLTGVSTARATMAMLHISETKSGVASMRMTGTLDLVGGATVALAPGGTHIMLTGLKSPLTAGEKVPLTLDFAASPDQHVDVAVVAPGER